MTPTARAVALAALTALLLTACNGDAETDANGGASATFVAVDVDFDEAPTELSAGSVEVELVNEGNMPHNVVFEGVDGDSPVAEAAGGETATGTVDLEPGEHVAYCGVPGHRESGMEVTVTVE